MDKKTILIVEDEPIIALNLKQVLIDLGYDVFGIANNRCNTIRLLESESKKPDLILMDIYLQGPTTGIEVAKELKDTIPDVPVIFLTANSEIATIKEASETFAYGYIIKPYKKSHLLASIEVALNKAKEDKNKKQDFEAVKNINESLELKLSLNEKVRSRTVKLKYGYLFDKEKEILYYGDEAVSLTSKELSIIKVLCETPGQIISQEQMEYAIWRDEPPGYAAFRSVLFRLRNKIHKDLITNLNNTGYKIELM